VGKKVWRKKSVKRHEGMPVGVEAVEVHSGGKTDGRHVLERTRCERKGKKRRKRKRRLNKRRSLKVGNEDSHIRRLGHEEVTIAYEVEKTL